VTRIDQRQPNELRKLNIKTNVIRHAEGSALIELGHTHVLCTASVENKLPKWMMGQKAGWVTAEYGMLPRSTHDRITREKAFSSGRSQEISRLIGRSLRSAVRMEALGEKQIHVDCDVIQADGGTRTAAITGGFVALGLALKHLHENGELKDFPLRHYVAAVSVGWQKTRPLLDLNYEEDSNIHTDMNFVLTNKSTLIEIQGTAEQSPFTKEEFSQMLDMAVAGTEKMFKAQFDALAGFLPLEG
jgi:ribonuclease PH